LEGGEFGHIGKSGAEGIVEGSEKDGGWLYVESERAHVGGDVRFFGESDDERKIVGVGAEMEVTIEEMLCNVG